MGRWEWVKIKIPFAYVYRWFTELKNGGWFHGYVTNNQRVHELDPCSMFKPQKNRQLRIAEVEFYPLVIFHVAMEAMAHGPGEAPSRPVIDGLLMVIDGYEW